eukprot:920537-Pelagomonas_calceolata.AAC.1
MRWSGTLSGRDLAVAIGRNHTQSASPHFQPFHLLDACQLNETVAKHISRVNPSSSPGFDTVLPSSVKYACKLVQREDGRGFHSINVLTPCVSQLLILSCNELFVFPQEWKIDKITPLYKKGPLTDADNYRMLAVSGTFYHLYANVM